MPAWIALVLQVLIQMILQWIKGKLAPADQPAALKEFEAALAEAQATKSTKPLRDLWNRLRK